MINSHLFDFLSLTFNEIRHKHRKMTQFGDNLKKLRTEIGLSQEELADKVTMHKTHISRYERNLAKPTVEGVKKLCIALDVSADLLVFGNHLHLDEGIIKDIELASLFKKVQELASGDIEVIKSLMNAFILKTELTKKLLRH